MNNKEEIKKILLLSVFILNDKQYLKLKNLLENGKLNIARCMIDTLLETKEISVIINPENQEFVNDYKQLNNLHDLIINIIVNDEKKNEERTQFKQFIER